ncbi:MAG: histidine phosphatase family protein [Muribaculaceae bacterium]|nr:histidine phosphatase family protein [Muribaculaceae bacterium]
MTPEKSGGIYYAYPEPSGKLTPAPAGFTPFYISHYGRHGSRWITSDARYEAVINEFSRNERNMTDLGRDVYDRLLRVWDDARGHGGELTPLGHRQHHAIGRRMAERYPEIFAGSASISARSSTAGRCIMSMAALCEGLKECNPSLHITREAAARHMDYIAYNSPEALRLGADTAPWRERFRAFEDSVLNPERLMASLFIIPDSINNKRALYEGLYWIASDMQNVEPDISFYDIFTAGELFEMWQTINYRMYVANANSAEGDRHGIESARPLLDNIIQSADSAIASGNIAASLRFGHDTHLIRLLALIGIKGCDSRADDPRHYCDIWQDFRISPMAANLQMIFYRNTEGHILVKFLHNEEETAIPINSSTAPYYDWNEVKRHLSRCINSN